MQFCKENIFAPVSTYVDDGFSGLNFNRPGFQRLLSDIDRGCISTVITKDLSRLGRDYIQTGYYIDVYFIERNVRYIAVNDNVDTGQGENDIAPFKNILNEMLSLRRVRQEAATADRIRNELGDKPAVSWIKSPSFFQYANIWMPQNITLPREQFSVYRFVSWTYP